MGTREEEQHNGIKEERLSKIAVLLLPVGSGVGVGTSRYTYSAIYSTGTGTGTDTDTGTREEEQHNGIREERLSEIAVLLLRVGSGVGAIPRRHPRVS